MTRYRRGWRVADVTPLPLDVARWAHLTVDVANADREADVIVRIAAELAGLHAQSEGRPPGGSRHFGRRHGAP